MYLISFSVHHFFADSPFTLTSKATGLCILKKFNRCLDVRWTTGDRLFIVTTRKCLGAPGNSLGSEVSSYDCDEKSEKQKWECKNETLLALKGQQLYIEMKADETLSLSRTIGPNNHLTVAGSNRGACSRTYRGTVPREQDGFIIQVFTEHILQHWRTVVCDLMIKD